MSTETADGVEVIEESVELAPSETGLVAQTQGTEREREEDIFWLAQNIDRKVEARNKIMTAMLKLAKPGDWVSFSSTEDPHGTASLGYDGAMRISANAGISYIDRKVMKIRGVDKLGEWYRYEAEVTCLFRSTQVRTWGRASTRDAFFGKVTEYKDGKKVGERWRDLSEINEGNVKMAAIHGAMKEGVKVLLGLTSFPVKDLMEMNVNVDFTKGHQFQSRGGETAKPVVNAEGESNMREKMRAMLLEINDEDQKKAADMLESLTSFQGKDGPVKGKRLVDYLKGPWLLTTCGKVKDAYKQKFGRDYAVQPDLAPPQ